LNYVFDYGRQGITNGTSPKPRGDFRVNLLALTHASGNPQFTFVFVSNHSDAPKLIQFANFNAAEVTDIYSLSAFFSVVNPQRIICPRWKKKNRQKNHNFL
jgi:hypothetical protein